MREEVGKTEGLDLGPPHRHRVATACFASLKPSSSSLVFIRFYQFSLTSHTVYGARKLQVWLGVVNVPRQFIKIRDYCLWEIPIQSPILSVGVERFNKHKSGQVSLGVTWPSGIPENCSRVCCIDYYSSY